MTKPNLLTAVEGSRSAERGPLPRIDLGDPVPDPPLLRPEEEIKASWERLQPPLITCICHTYNHVDFIEYTLRGMLGQTTQYPFEIIVHDDASTDGTRDVIEEYVGRYPGLIVPILQRENQYRLGKKPSCFTMPRARGQFVALCEGDDYWIDERKLEVQVQQLSANPRAVIAHHDAIIIEDGRVVSLSKLPTRNRRNLSAAEVRRAPWLLTASLMFRRAARRAVPETYLNVVNGDDLLISVLGLEGGAVYDATLKPVVYRRHSGGIWSRTPFEAKRAHQFRTYCTLALYHRTESIQPDLTRYFLLKAVRRAIPGRGRRASFGLQVLWEEARAVFRGTWVRIRRLVLRSSELLPARRA